MLGQRRANELDNFLSHNQPNTRMISPRNPPLNNLTNNYFSNPYADHNKFERNTSPNTVTNVRKPMISPARSPRSMAPANNPAQRMRTKQDTQRTREHFCQNQSHKNKKAEYIIHIEDEDMYYCGICATQAASQGFTVNRINAPPQAFPNPRKQKVIPHHPAYTNNKRYHELTELMSEIITAEAELKKKDSKAIQEHYRQQEKLLNGFYDEQIEVIQRMRTDHLNDLKMEEENNIHACQAKMVGLKELMADLNSAWDDIEEAFTDIVELIMEEQYQEGMQTYRRTIDHFQQKVYEMESSLNNFTSYDLKGLNIKIKTFESKLMELWTDEGPQQPQSRRKIPEKVPKVGTMPTSVKVLQGNTLKNVHQNLAKTPSHGNFERPEPFRNLFPEDDAEERLPEASPQFKAF